MSLPWMSEEERAQRERSLEEARAWGTHGATRCPICKGVGRRIVGCGLLDALRSVVCSTCKGAGKI